MQPRDYIHKFHASRVEKRLHLTAPARDGGSLYASNGVVLIVTDDDPDVSALADSKLPGLAKPLLAPIAQRENWTPVDQPLPPPANCLVCGGTGKTTVCATCQGNGFVEDDLGEEESCPSCNGMPEWPDENGQPCWHCDGSGEHLVTVPFENAFFARRYVALLQSLPGPVLLSTGQTPSDVAFFRFTGGFGALMPCREK